MCPRFMETDTNVAVNAGADEEVHFLSNNLWITGSGHFHTKPLLEAKQMMQMLIGFWLGQSLPR